ncbi:MAG: efflux RND transporter periplasmic adaptor subunit, partial [Candidatus Marinimicrobia bacterium]|nr:efflux RND transporter periplasmic adaptor subunit [Candidatus Neomarinimicrobiota bacterium]
IMKKVIITIGIIFTVIFISCSKNDEQTNYTNSANNIVELTNNFVKSGSENPKNYLAEVKKIVDRSASANKEEAEFDIVPVSVIPVTKGSIEESISYFGDIEAKYSIPIYPKTPEKIEKFFVDDGDYVKKGQRIAQINNEQLKYSVNQAQAGLKSAKSQYKNTLQEYRRTKTLFEENAISKSQYDQIKTQKEMSENSVNQAKAALNTAEKMLNDALITAPISGYVSNRDFDDGDMVSPQRPLLTISQMDMVKVITRISEEDISKVKIGMKARINVNAFQDEVFYGKINRISPIIDLKTRTVKVVIVVNNSDLKLKPGMFSEVNIITDSKDNCFVLNKNYILEKTTAVMNTDDLRDKEIVKKYFLFVTKDNMAIKKEVNIGLKAEYKYEINSGLTGNELIITKGLSNVTDSSMVKVVK